MATLTVNMSSISKCRRMKTGFAVTVKLLTQARSQIEAGDLGHVFQWSVMYQ